MVALQRREIAISAQPRATLRQWHDLRQSRPDLDLNEYDRALARERRARNGKDNRNEEQKMTDKALIEQVHATISATDPYEKYKQAVWDAFRGNSKIKEHHLRALAQISYNFGLNPNPGLGLIYGWYNQDGAFMVAISYLGWLALGHRCKKFTYTHRRLSAEESAARGNLDPNDIVVECKVYDMAVMEDVKALKAMGFEVNPTDFVKVGIGVWRKGFAVPKGRDPEWVAKKNATKDAVKQLIADQFTIASPHVEGMYYDSEKDGWVSSDVVEGVSTPAVDDIAYSGEAIDRPYAPEALIDEIRAEAESQRDEHNQVIDPAQLKRFHAIFSKLSKTDADKKAFILTTFGKDSSKKLASCEADAITDWIAADEELAQQEWLMWLASYQQSVQEAVS